MTTSSEKTPPTTPKPVQQPLPLSYRGSPFVQRMRNRFGIMSEILDKASYWRSFPIWTNLLLNIGLSIFLFSIVLFNLPDMPSVIPVLYLSNKTSDILVPTEYLFALLIVHLLLQLFLLSYCSRIYNKSRTLTNLSLTLLIISAALFYFGFYKSIRMNF